MIKEDIIIDTGTREAARLHLDKQIPITLKGKHDKDVRFQGAAVGISINGLGVRTSDEKILRYNIEELFRQALEISFYIEDDIVIEGCARVIRVEYSKKDPKHEYFIALKFIYMPPEYEKKLKDYIQFYQEKKD